MKKIGIITFHMSFNHGAMLQAYGLSKKLELMGYDAKIIDYRLPYIDKFHHKDFLKELIVKQGPIGVAKYIKRRFTHYYDDPAWNKFYRFMNKLPLSRQIGVEKLGKLKYDCVITGSDQVWNGKLTGGIQGCYFLDFVQAGVKKIAYAASSGTDRLEEERIDKIYEWLRQFDAIGVREKSLHEYIVSKLNIPAQNVLDPTLLLEDTEWMKLIHPVPYEKYLLLYVFDEEKVLYEKAIEYANRQGLKIITLAYVNKNLGNGIIELTDCGPEDFLSYIYYADAVITSSFHGTVFSIIFKKNFYCFPHPKYHERTDSLLAITGLEDRIVLNDGEMKEETINYQIVYDKLEKEKKKSEEFLREAIEKEGESVKK